MCFPNRASRNSENPFAFGSLILPLRGAYLMTPGNSQSSPPNRPRRGGRKPGPAEQKQRHVVSVRLTDAEHARLNQEAEQFNRSQGEVLRAVWLNQNTATKLPAPRTPEQARELAQLAGMAANLNQLTKQGHQGQDIRSAVVTVLRQMHALLNSLAPDAT